ncbi:AMP-binding enzyme, partial [Xanthomonas campestris]|uniref:AMP-binding enzyme n=1 Tax=Xanthomonas campestris TaxID=339 RepID=UPI003CE7B5A9
VNGVLEAAVIGVPHPKWGETAWALVAPKSGAMLTSEHVLDHLQGRLARYKHPTRVIIVDELPKNGAGKVDKLVLRERYRT